jgi:regulator of nonsense transcripts 1
VRLRYEDGNQYFNILNPLVALEADYDRKVKEAMNYAVSQVRWDVGLNKKVIASFNLPEFRDGSKSTIVHLKNNYPRLDLKLMIGDELRLKHQQTVDGSDWTCEGRIVKIPDSKRCVNNVELNFCLDHSDKFVLELSSNCELPSNKRTNFMCEFVWKGTAFKRMREGS